MEGALQKGYPGEVKRRFLLHCIYKDVFNS